MNDDTSISNFPTIPGADGAAMPMMLDEAVTQRLDMARRWLDHAQALMANPEAVDPNDVLLAICAANDNLTELDNLQPGFAGFVAGVEAGIAALVEQRDALATAYDQLEAELEDRVRREVEREVPEIVAQILATEEDVEEAEIDLLAREMMLGDEEEIVNEAIKRLARKLNRARELAQEYRITGLPDEEYTEDADGEEVYIDL